MNENYAEILKGKVVSNVEKTEGCLKIHFSDGTILESVSQSEDSDYSSDIILDVMEPRAMPLNEAVTGKSNGEPVRGPIVKETIQLLDTVSYNKEKAYVTGQLSSGEFLIQLSKTGQIKQVKENEITLLKGKAPAGIQQFKFDKETQKVLFEQFIKCGVYMGNVPVKMNDCFVQYSEWIAATPDQNINVLVEGMINLFPKNNIHIYEDVNDFANINDLVPGTIPDMNDPLGGARKKVWVKLDSHRSAIGGADEVFCIDMETNKPLTVPADQVEITQEISINATDMLNNI